MYVDFIHLDMGCHSCSQVTLDIIFNYKSNEELSNPSRSKIISIISPDDIICPHCESAGECEIFSADFNGYIYDFREPEPTDGILMVEVKKMNEELRVSMGSDRSGWSLVDHINTVNYAIERLASAKESIDDPTWSFKPLKNGNFFYKAHYGTLNLKPLAKGDSYFGFGEIKAGLGGSYGIDYSELEKILIRTKDELMKKRERY